MRLPEFARDTLPASAKDIHVAPIASAAAKALVKRLHYSGKTTQNSQLHLGVFLDKRLEGVMQFGPSLDKSRIQGLVADTPWNGFLELNRMAFSDRLPRNSESRALGIAFRIIRKHYPHIQWVVSFADGAQCGDGTIYRAAGFALTGITKNSTLWKYYGDEGEGGEVVAKVSVTKAKHLLGKPATNLSLRQSFGTKQNGSASMRQFKEMGFRPIPGFQLRYIYFLHPTARERLKVPIIPFSKIDEMGAGMYLGKARVKQAMAEHPSEQRRGSSDPHAPDSEQKKEAAEAASSS
jgi:hypothetical protein